MTHIRNRNKSVWIWLLSLVFLAFACGIDDHSDEEEASGEQVPPSITGIWEGFFQSAMDGETIAITRLTAILSQASTYTIDFDVDMTSLEGFVIWFWLNQQKGTGSVDEEGNLFVTFGGSSSGMVLNGKVDDDEENIKGQWILNYPFEDDGTWIVRKISDLDP